MARSAKYKAKGLLTGLFLVLSVASPAVAAAPRGAPGRPAVAPAPGAVIVRGSVNQVFVTRARPGERLALLGRQGRVIVVRPADSLGGLVFRGVAAGGVYRVRDAGGGAASRPVRVMRDRPAPPNARIYDQRIPTSGYGYLRTRDGTLLAIDVRLPAGPGPYPTLVEYSGYGYADPAGAENGISPIATLLGFAVVDVNMRGTGCSGGAFDYFEPLQSLDGYDVIETVARQPWVLYHRVGMVGISYGGISQLYVAATEPPSLAAIAPMSVIDDAVTTLYPGGILNTGFAVPWAAQLDHDALPASPAGGQGWALARIRRGDRVCQANQVLHGEAVNEVAQIHAHRYYTPALARRLSPVGFVDRITVPVFLACQWQDEQTGGHCPDLAEHFGGTQRKWFTFTNGTHVDSLDPATMVRWFDFLELYVARRAPRLSPAVRALAPAVYEAAMGISGVTLPDDPIQQQPSFEAALGAYEQLPSVQIAFDNGGGGSIAGAPVAAFQQLFDRFPLPGTVARSWYLGPGGTLSDTAPATAGTESFRWDKKARPATSFTGNTSAGGLWGATPRYHWTPNPPGTAVSYTSDPLSDNVVVVGAGSLQAWIRSSARDVDLQVTLSEVRPDGQETFVQDGWLRASERRLDASRSTLLEPVLSLRRSDAAPLPRGRFTEITVPLDYEGHVYRAGSRIRVTIEAPSGDQPVWSFADTVPRGRATVAVARGGPMPSRIVLPVVAGVAVPTALPPCRGLRGEPCRG